MPTADNQQKTIAQHMFVITRLGPGTMLGLTSPEKVFMVTLGDPRQPRSTTVVHCRNEDGIREWLRNSGFSHDHIIDVSGIGFVSDEFSDFYMDVMALGDPFRR